MASDFGLTLASFDYSGSEENDLALKSDTQEKYIGYNPIPVYLGAKYTSKLRPTITLVKDTANLNKNNSKYFTEHECRYILRELTSEEGYQWVQIYHNTLDELMYYYARINNIRYKKIMDEVVGIIIEMECDSPFAWSKEFRYSYDIKANVPLTFYNTSDILNDYLLPTVMIRSSSAVPKLILTNKSDNNRVTELTSIDANEIITMNSKNEVLSIPSKEYPLNYFNLKWFRLVSGKNEIISNHDINITFRYRVARKVGFITV